MRRSGVARAGGRGWRFARVFRWFWRNPELVRSGGRVSHTRSPAVLVSARAAMPGREPYRKITATCGAPEGAASRKRCQAFWMFAFATRMFEAQTIRCAARRSTPLICEGENETPARPRRKEWG